MESCSRSLSLKIQLTRVLGIHSQLICCCWNLTSRESGTVSTPVTVTDSLSPWTPYAVRRASKALCLSSVPSVAWRGPGTPLLRLILEVLVRFTVTAAITAPLHTGGLMFIPRRASEVERIRPRAYRGVLIGRKRLQVRLWPYDDMATVTTVKHPRERWQCWAHIGGSVQCHSVISMS